MHAKHCIIICIILLSLAVTGTEYEISAATASPATAEQHNTTQWKTIPEDSTSWRREPFKSPETLKQIPGLSAKQSSPDFSLQGIMKSNKHYYAIINGRTVRRGDQIDGWTIAEINRYRVTIRHEKEKQIYDIYQGRIDRGSR